MKSNIKRMSLALISFVLILGFWPVSKPSAQEPVQSLVDPAANNLIYNGGFEEWGPRYDLSQTPIQPGWPMGWMLGEKWESDGWIQPGGEPEWFPPGDPQAILQTSGDPRDEGGYAQGGNNGTLAVYLGNPWQAVGYSLIKQIVPVTPGAEYELSFSAFGWNRLNVPEGSVNRLAVRAYVWFLDEHMMPLGYPNHAPRSFDSPPGETPGFGLMIKLPDGGIGVPPGYKQFIGRTAIAPAGAKYAEIQFGRYSAGGACIDDVSFTKVEAACPNCINFDQLASGIPVPVTQYQSLGVVFDPGLITWGFSACSGGNSVWGGENKKVVLKATFVVPGFILPVPGVTDCVSICVAHFNGPSKTSWLQAYDLNGNPMAGARTLVNFGPEGFGKTYSVRAPGIRFVTLEIPEWGAIDDFCFGPITPIPGQADLVVKNLRLPTILPVVRAGSMTWLTFNIVNQGTESADSARHEIHLLANQYDPHGGPTVAVDLLLATATTGTLAAGASQSFNALVMIPQNIAPGVGKFRVVADAGNAVTESNEENNRAEVSITITGGQV